MSDNRDALLAKIRAIASRTTENGCTEAEALAAAAMLAKLMSEHGLSMSDVEIGEELCQIEYLDTGRRALHESSYCIVRIAELCDCRVWTCWTRQGEEYIYKAVRSKKIAYFGLPGDVETAVYLTRVIKSSMDQELLTFIRRCAELGEPSGRRVNHSFLMGMVNRVNVRLGAIKASERTSAKSATGRDLVAVKGAVVTAQFAKLDLHLRSHTKQTSIGDASAYRSGQAAGDRVSFNRAVSQSGGTVLLGGRS